MASNMKAGKLRIKSVQRTMQITKAMELVASSKLRKAKERAEERKSQVGSGDRSERIRTYNFPQNRLTDHRINLTLYKLDLIMEGHLEDVVEALKIAAGEEALKEAQ